MYASENKTNDSKTSINKIAAKASFFQPKLTINQPNDIYEQEADAMADKVMRMPDATTNNNSFFKPAITSIQRKCAHCEEEEKSIQKKVYVPVVQRQESDPGAGQHQQLNFPDLQLHTSFLPQSTGPDYLGMRQPFFNRGIIHLWDPDSALQLWNFNFNTFRKIGFSPDTSASLSNFTAPFAIDNQLKAGNPTWWEITDRELKTTTYQLNLPLFNLDPDFAIKPPTWWNTLFKRKAIETNLPKDAAEEEAEKVAEKVVNNKEINSDTFLKPKINVLNIQRRCAHCEADEKKAQRKEIGNKELFAPVQTENYINTFSGGKTLSKKERSFFEPRMGYDFSNVRLHTNSDAAQSAQSINALAYTTGNNIVFNKGQYNSDTDEGKKLLGHELTHVVQQDAGQSKKIQLRAAPYIKKITVHLTPPQNADLEWQGTPPDSATGSDHFRVSTGKGYSNPGDDAGTCIRTCCTDADKQCAPPWNRPDKVGACCTYYGDSFWTGTPEEDHNGVSLWTPIQPYYSSRGIALHEYPEVTGQPIGHGCVRMDEPNAKRIFDFSNGRQTNVTIDGRAAPVDCPADRSCSAGKTGQLTTTGEDGNKLAENNTEVQPVEGLEALA